MDEMNIVLLHEHHDEKALEKIIAIMKRIGPPAIHAIYDEANDMYVALEGCHRLRAAEKLNLPVTILEVEYSDEPLKNLAWSDLDNDYTVAEIFDTAARRYNDGIYVTVAIVD